MAHKETVGFEGVPQMTTTGLYEDFESGFSGLATAITNYLQAKNRITPQPGDLSVADCQALLLESLKDPAPEYVAFLEKRRPDIAEEVLRQSQGRAVVLINATIRALNTHAERARQQIEQGADVSDALHDVMGSLNQLYAQMARTDIPFAV